MLSHRFRSGRYRVYILSYIHNIYINTPIARRRRLNETLLHCFGVSAEDCVADRVPTYGIIIFLSSVKNRDHRYFGIPRGWPECVTVVVALYRTSACTVLLSYRIVNSVASSCTRYVPKRYEAFATVSEVVIDFRNGSILLTNRTVKKSSKKTEVIELQILSNYKTRFPKDGFGLILL